MKLFASHAAIRATPETIWGILTDAPNYPSWNRTVVRVDGRIALGETLTVHAAIAPGRVFPVKVVTFDAPARMVWTSAMPLGLFRGERIFDLHAGGAGETQFAMREEYRGLLAPLITKSIPDLQPAFDDFAACLKSRAERG
jgi:hypothetical protein